MSCFEFKSCLVFSRRLIEQIKECSKKTPSTKQEEERAKVLSDPMKQSDLYFVHAQILSKVGRFGDSVIYSKKALSVLTLWTSSLPPQQRNQVMASMEHRKRMNRYYGFLGLSYLKVDDVENALQCFKKAKNVNALDRIAQSNITNITQNRALFDRFVDFMFLCSFCFSIVFCFMLFEDALS